MVLPLRCFLPPMFPSSLSSAWTELILTILAIIQVLSLVICDMVWAAGFPLSELLYHLSDLVTDLASSLVMTLALVYLAVPVIRLCWYQQDDVVTNQGKIHGAELLLSISNN